MLNYPLSVFLDTNIFISSKYDFGNESTLDLLKKHINAKRINLYVSNIVIREVEKHICLDISKAIQQFRSARKEALEAVSLNFINGTPLSPFFSLPSKEEMKKIALAKFQEFITDSKAICLDNAGVNIDTILDDYFAGNPPFESREEKKFEFPDALIISKLKNQFSKHNPVWIISKDKGFQSAFRAENGFNTLSSIKELLDMINRHDELYERITVYLQHDVVRTNIIQKLKEKINSYDILVDGMDCDRKGYCEGHEYDESYIEDVSEVDFYLSSVDNISDNIVSVTINCVAKIIAICTYLDADNSIWDSEEKEYLYSSWESLEEEHRPDFECMLHFSIVQDDKDIDFLLTDLSLDLVLNQNSRVSRSYIEPEDPKASAEADELDALEEYFKH